MMEFVAKEWLKILFGVIVAILTGLYRKLEKQIKLDQEKRKAADDGVQALLRDRIVQAYNHYALEKKYCPIYAKDNINALYEAYHRLGGNGVVTGLKEKLDALPTEPQ